MNNSVDEEILVAQLKLEGKIHISYI